MKTDKAIRAELMEWQTRAYKLELENELNKLILDFNRWKNEEISPFELNQILYKYQKDISKELFLKYERPSFADLNIASAIIDGFINPEDLSEELKKLILPKVEMLQKL